MATKRPINFGNDVDFELNQALNIVVEILATAPDTTSDTRAVAGRIVSYQGDLYIGDGTKFTKLGDSGEVAEVEARVDDLEVAVDGTEAQSYADGLKARVTAIENSYATKVSAVAGKGLATINGEGIVTQVDAPETSDLTDWDTVDANLVHVTDLIGTSAGATDAGKAIKLNSSGKIDNTMIPPLAIGEIVGTVSSKADLVTLSTAEKGDLGRVSGDTVVNNNGIYWLNGTYSVLTDWVQIVGPSEVISVNGKTGVVVLTKADVGLENVDNTADLDKPISTAVQTALDNKMGKFASAPAGGKVLVSVAGSQDSIAESASTLGTATKPVYLANGVLTEGTQIESAGYKTADTGALDSTSTDAEVPTSKAVYTALTTGVVTKVGTVDVGATDTPVFLDDGTPTAVTSISASLLPFKVGEKSGINTVANTDYVFAHGLDAVPKVVTVYNSSGEVIQCYVKVDSTNITINTSASKTGLRVGYIG